jgi:hypothetical protein
MAKQRQRKEGAPSRKFDEPVEEDSLLIRSAESLGRVIGTLQRQLRVVQLAGGDAGSKKSAGSTRRSRSTKAARSTKRAAPAKRATSRAVSTKSVKPAKSARKPRTAKTTARARKPSR